MGAAQILKRVEGKLGRITLNRPEALNALTLEMVRAIDEILTTWEQDDQISAILLDGAGDRGLCAGGDIRSIFDAIWSGETAPVLTFWSEEYRLNARLSHFPKPIVAVMSGLVMGGGVGISAHVRHRIVTDTTSVGMPEASIGFVPDVGGTYLLSRAPGELGTHMALTGGRVGPADTILLGLADVYIDANRVGDLAMVLRHCSGGQVGEMLSSLASEPAEGELSKARSWIDGAYAFDDVAMILAALERSGQQMALRAAAQIRRNSPTSLKVTLRALREARRLPNLETCLVSEFRIAAACLAGHDMLEGIRAAVINKDRAPIWSPAHIDEVTQAMVDRHFEDLASAELAFSTSKGQRR